MPSTNGTLMPALFDRLVRQPDFARTCNPGSPEHQPPRGTSYYGCVEAELLRGLDTDRDLHAQANPIAGRSRYRTTAGPGRAGPGRAGTGRVESCRVGKPELTRFCIFTTGRYPLNRYAAPLDELIQDFADQYIR
jgi:hypothetical protein